MVVGRSLIRTFLAGATKTAAICFVSEEQAQRKKEMNRFGSFEKNNYL